MNAFTGFDCDGLNFFVYLSIPYLTLVIGNYYAGSIKILSLQLERLIASKNELLGIQTLESQDVFERMDRLNKGKKDVHRVFTIKVFVLLLIFLIDYIVTKNEDKTECT